MSSIPSDYGIGDFGPACIEWLDILKDASQTLWQVLPLGPTGFGDSPYQSSSTFALNLLFLSVEKLHEQGLLSDEELEASRFARCKNVQYGQVYGTKRMLNYFAARRFAALPDDSPLRQRYTSFVEDESWWLDDFALYSVIKSLQGNVAWVDWPKDLRDRDPGAMEKIRRNFAWNIECVRCVQFLLREQWGEIQGAARDRGIRIIGDLPIFVAHDSVDVWANRDMFLLEPDGSPTVVAGVPPDYFSATGQLWGNPIYNWQHIQKTNYEWWLKRIRKTLDIADVIRIDHFRGFVSTWEVPGGESTAMNGQWVDVPGRALLEKLWEENPEGTLPIIAEDLGVITPEVTALRDDFGLPGIRVLQFAFGNDPMRHTFEPESYVNNCVAYSGTHDNDMVVGWFYSEANQGSTRAEEAVARERANAIAYFGTDGRDIHLDFIQALYQSQAGAVIVPLQDVLGLDSKARFNLPGTASGNWQWCLDDFSVVREEMPRLSQYAVEFSRGRYYQAACCEPGQLGKVQA